MPIYAYKCLACGHEKDVLQKVSDAPLSVCPACGAQAYAKQLTAAGFQLKGSGWYATDFKGAAKPASEPAQAESAKSEPAKTESATAASAAAPACGTGACPACQ